jgi:adenylosuccinate synthase
LGFGDCGKGIFVDALTRRWHAHTVVRFSGGAQAGHNVVTLERHHTFSQFSSGTLVPGTRTVLLDPMVFHPTALLAEAGALARIGIDDALPRLTIDAQCRVTTPYHQAAGQLRELLRGDAPHGTCGVGVGETVRHAFEYPEQVLRYGDLSRGTPPDKLNAIRKTLLDELEPLSAGMPELETLRDETLARRWLNATSSLVRQCPPASVDTISAQLRQGCVLFEGAQGVLLDESRGFHPYTTWSSITTAAVENAAARLGLTGPIEHYGVMRTYLTRHGVGPFPTHDESLDDQLPEPHNGSAGWQGRFRRGHPDEVLLRYALDAIGPLSGLFVSHLDVFERGVSLKWCERYANASRLRLGAPGDLSYQEALTKLLMNAHPQYASKPIDSKRAYFERLSSVIDLPVALCSSGNTSADIASRGWKNQQIT